MKTVFVVTHGEMQEVGIVKSVHKAKDAAIKAALKTKTDFEGGWLAEAGEDSVWVNGCDFVEVTEQQVH